MSHAWALLQPPPSVQELYNGEKYDQAADPAPQSGTYLGEALSIVQIEAVPEHARTHSKGS